jgi:hypothetical protein
MTRQYLLCPPWRPISTAPKDGREFIGLWADIDGAWNVDMMVWSNSNGQVMSTNGNLYDPGYVQGWMPRPPLPGPARQD